MQNKSKSFRVYFIENKFNWNSVVLLLVTIVILGCLVNYLFSSGWGISCRLSAKIWVWKVSSWNVRVYLAVHYDNYVFKGFLNLEQFLWTFYSTLISKLLKAETKRHKIYTLQKYPTRSTYPIDRNNENDRFVWAHTFLFFDTRLQ